jgi:hypothetical protein
MNGSVFSGHGVEERADFGAIEVTACSVLVNHELGEEAQRCDFKNATHVEFNESVVSELRQGEKRSGLWLLRVANERDAVVKCMSRLAPPPSRLRRRSNRS